MKIFLTSSRRPSRRTRSFIKDLALILNVKRFNRGKSSLSDLISMLNEGDRLVIVDTMKGNPSRIRVYSKEGLLAIFLIKKVKLLREFKSEILKKINCFTISTERGMGKDFAEILGIKDEEKKECISLSFHSTNIEKLKDYEEVRMIFNSKNLGVFFYIKRFK